MSLLNGQFSDPFIAEDSTMILNSRVRRTIPSSALVPVSFIGFALLLVGPAIVRAQVTSPKPSPYKGFSGLWVRKDSIKQVYHYDQTVAVVELGPGKSLENCELVEVTTPEEEEETLEGLQSVSQPINVTFQQMFELMNHCHDFTSPLEKNDISERSARIIDSAFSGIVPGTKWCGNSDIAKTYFDLGIEKEVDKCCRTHDLCPVKVRGYATTYNLTNEQFYTKSHCDCDHRFQQCLKKTNTPLSRLMGNVYFNIMRVPCVEDIPTKCDASGCQTKRFQKSMQFT